MLGEYTDRMKLSGKRAFEKPRDPMDRLCRVAVAVELGESDAEQEYSEELMRLGYEVRPGNDVLIRPNARQLVVPAGKNSPRKKLKMDKDGPEVRIMDAQVIGVDRVIGVVSVRTWVMAPANPRYRTAIFADVTARGRVLTLGVPSKHPPADGASG